MIRLLGVADIVRIHDEILAETGIGLPGLAGDKDLAGTLGRIANRISYELHDDLLRVAAFYAVAIATGHCFNDGNKRTAFVTMDVFLRMNGLVVVMDEDTLVEMMVQTAAGRLGHESLTERIADHLYELVAAREAGEDDEAPPAD
ncbi:type II toxin-antitoxin system death-on-curing family toxin [Tahibacter sp. UC22_41]|uniref:type II toxin-antitoxin system death-on-curing family toxin n=1 Tax=Tahibacter sp. UC22_41 TaxID=3350178 RepID=UPI0036DA8B25